MRDLRRISLFVVLAVLGDAAAAYAQGNPNFNRVTTAQRDARIDDGGSQRQVRSNERRQVRDGRAARSLTATAATGAVRPGGARAAGVAAGRARASPLRSYSRGAGLGSGLLIEPELELGE